MDLHEIWYTYRTEDALSNDTKVILIGQCFQGQTQGHSKYTIIDLEFDLENNMRLCWPWCHWINHLQLYKWTKFPTDPFITSNVIRKTRNSKWRTHSVFCIFDPLNDLQSAINIVCICIELRSTKQWTRGAVHVTTLL